MNWAEKVTDLIERLLQFAEDKHLTEVVDRPYYRNLLLDVMNLALAIFTLYFVFRIRVFLHHEITTIAMAAYTFTALTMAIINVVRYKKYRSPAYSAAKDISLVSATVSMLTLENALLTTFDEGESELFRQIMLGTSGAAVIFIVQGIALYMIINANRKIRINKSQT